LIAKANPRALWKENLMSDETQPYTISIHELSEALGELAFTFVPKGLQQVPVHGELPRRVPQYIVVVRKNGESITFDWGRTPDDPGPAMVDLEEIARQRVNARLAWVGRVEKLVAEVERWGQDLGWQTRRIDKRLDDSYVGKHRLPALLMQEETFRVLLEPVGRSAPGAEGIVDLYLLPAYDDIASLYFYGGQWNVHYYFQGVAVTGNIRETPGKPLSKEVLESVLDEMRANAA
jgi:hypothetical protein